MKVRGLGDSGAADLLLRCLSDGREPIADLREPTTDWNEVVAMAFSYDLAPLLFRSLKKSDALVCVPDDAWERLRVAYFAGAARNKRRYQELRTVLRCLRSSGIPVIVLKGAFLAEAVYGDVALRHMSDVDLLVPRAELSGAQAILLDLGYGSRGREEVELLCRRRKHLEQLRKDGLATEIHWTIASPTGPFRIDTAGLWDRALPAAIAGVEVLALSPEDLLLHLCLHFCYQHHLAGLIPLCDIAETIHRYRGEIDWPQVVDRAREWGAARYVGLTLHSARSMLDAEVPEDVLGQLVPVGIDQRILDTAREFVFAETGYSPWVPLFDLQGAKSLGDKAKLTWERVFLARDKMAKAYPASGNSRHLYVYYVLRLRDVIRAFGSHTLRRYRLMTQNRGRDRNAALVDWLKSGKE